MGVVTVERRADQFLSGILQRTVYSLQLPSTLSEANRASLQEWLDSGEADFVGVKTDVRAANVHEQLRGMGFVIVDELVTFAKRIDKKEPHIADGFSIRWAETGDEAAVVALASRAFRCSRWHNDPLFSAEQADRVKAAWARNFWQGKRGDGMGVVTQGERVVGFLMLLVQADALVVDLIAVDEKQRGRGLGTALVQWVEKNAILQPTLTKICLGTQQRNSAALALYIKLGFKETGRQYVWHWHMTGDLQ